MDTDEMEVDPAIAEAMGFSGFGMQTKKRKHDSNDAFVDTGSTATGSNSTPIHQGGGGSTEAASKQPRNSAGDPNKQNPATDADGKPTLEALRHGVRNENGDMVYFLPSFIEDPWKHLKST